MLEHLFVWDYDFSEVIPATAIKTFRSPGTTKNIGVTKVLFAYVSVVSTEASYGGVPTMPELDRSYLQKMETYGTAKGWVAPLDREDRAYLSHFRSVCKRYNIEPSKASKLEYEFVTKVTENEFYLHQAQG